MSWGTGEGDAGGATALHEKKKHTVVAVEGANEGVAHRWGATNHEAGRQEARDSGTRPGTPVGSPISYPRERNGEFPPV